MSSKPQPPTEPTIVDEVIKGKVKDQDFDQPALTPELVQRLIDAGVKQKLEEFGVSKSGPQTFIGASRLSAPSVVPDITYLKHYRNDVSPELEIVELDMDSEIPQLSPKLGQRIRFRRGHFFAMTENQVKQIEWIMNNPSHSGDGMSVIGGNRAIYEDDGEVIYYCRAGCSPAEFHTASKARYEAHMRAVHGVEV